MYIDTLIIGSGPCALACAARLRESTPSALFTDAEHARYWKRFARQETLQSELTRRRKASSSAASSNNTSSAAAASASSSSEKKHSTASPPASPSGEGSDSGYSSDASSPRRQHRHTTKPSRPSPTPTLLALTSSPPHFLSAWTTRFTTLRIPSLRSPLFFHPDPRDRDGLLAFAYETAREAELTEIPHVTGREVSKHAVKKARRRGGREEKTKVARHLRVDDRDRVDYFTPSTGLFADYCASIVARYGLGDVVRQATVQRVRYAEDDVGDPLRAGRVFTVETDRGVFFARTVIVATGPSAVPVVPRDCGLRIPVGGNAEGAATHVSAPRGTELPGYVREKIQRGKETSVVVVGGGLTSAQMAANLLRYEGVGHVYLLLRGKYKLKHFDVDLEWVSKTRNQRMAEFWSAYTDEERAEMLREAKGGGSVSPLFHEGVVKGLMREGRLSLCEHTRIVDGKWDEGRKLWQVKTSRALPKAEHANPGRRLTAVARKQAKRDADASEEESEKDRTTEIDHIFFATGVAPDFSKIPFLQDLPPIPTINNLPVLTEDLAYSEDIPLFFTGALAALRLGPGAANLAGARLGAERIAWKIEQMYGRGAVGSDRHRGDPPPSTYPKAASGSRPNGASTARPWTPDSSEGVKERSEFTGGFANQFAALDLDV